MAAYLTRDEFLDQSIPGEAFAGLTNEQIDTALAWASSKANMALRKRHTLPLVSWGDDLRQLVADLACYALCKRRGYKPGTHLNELIADAYENAIDTLLEISKGNLEIDCVDSTPLVDEGGSLAESDAPMSFRMTTGPLCSRCGPCCRCDDGY